MKSTYSFEVYFIARTKKSNLLDLWIFVRITVNPKVAGISFKRRIESQFWDQANKTIKGSKRLQNELKPFPDDLRYKLTDSFRQLQMARKHITASTLNETFFGKEV